MTRRDEDALVLQVAAEAQRLAPRFQRTPQGMAAVQKLDPTLLLGACVHVHELHEQFMRRGSCPLLRVIVADIVDRMRGCVRVGAVPLTKTDVRVLSHALEADIEAALRRLTNSNSTQAVLVGGATWTTPSLFKPMTWFRKERPPSSMGTYRFPAQRPLMTIPLVHPEVDDTDLAHVACAVLNTATITLCAAAAIAFSPVILGMYLGREIGIKQMKAEPNFQDGWMMGHAEGYQEGIVEANRQCRHQQQRGGI